MARELPTRDIAGGQSALHRRGPASWLSTFTLDEPMKSKLIIVTDLGLLKAYKLDATPKGTPRLELFEEVVIEDARHRLVEKVTDLAGRHVSPTAKKWGTPMADDHNLKLETKRRLIKQIAGDIKRLAESNGEHGCWLAAHKEINHLILRKLPKSVRARIETNLSRDLAKASRKELLAVFAPQLAVRKPPPARPAKS